MTEAFSTAIIQINACEYGETLEFRNGECLDFYSGYEDAHELSRSGFLYAFRLLRVPEPPGPSPVNVGFTVVCCRQFYGDSEWGWVNLPERTKEAMGQHLRLFLDSPEYNPVDK
jgi:hypothetical protein